MTPTPLMRLIRLLFMALRRTSDNIPLAMLRYLAARHVLALWTCLAGGMLSGISSLANASQTARAQNLASVMQTSIPPGRIVISGSVPDEATRTAFLTRLQALYGTDRVVDQLTVGGVMAPPEWSKNVTNLMKPTLQSISKGQLVVEGTTVALRGEVASEAVHQLIDNDISSALHSPYTLQNGLRVTAGNQTLLDQALANRIIEFERGSALLTEQGKTILDDMAIALKKIPIAKVDIVGHTDNRGTPAHNLALSRSRADSVKIYLVAQGISPHLIRTSGMGADQPVMANTTDDGRKRNRRIEFRVSQ